MINFGEDIDPDVRPTIVERLQRWLPQDCLAQAKVLPLQGGAINRNFFVDVADGYVLRMAPPVQTRGDIGIDMSNSAAVAEIAGRAGVGPRVVGFDEISGDTLIEFLPGVLNATAIRDDDVLRRVGGTVRRLHELPTGTIRRVSAFDEAEEWVANAVQRGATLPDGYDAMWALLQECRGVLESIEGECLSHRDLNPQNCIQSDGVVKLIDWDFSGVDSPYLDLAMLSTYAELDDRQREVLLSAAIPDLRAEDHARIQLMRFAHALREWAWCISATDVLVSSTFSDPTLLPTQACGEQNFYHGYRDVNWRFAQTLSSDERWASWCETASSSLPAPGFR